MKGINRLEAAYPLFHFSMDMDMDGEINRYFLILI
jgi:hypothetical protein